MPKQDPRVDAYIAKSADFAKPVLIRIRKLVHAACPDVTETIKWNSPFYEHKGILICTPAFKKHCALIFWKGKLFLGPDREKYRRLTSNADLPGDKILTGYIKQAVAINVAGVKVPRPRPKRGRKPVLPDYFLAALNKNKKALAAFENFSPGCQREYAEWISEAKREETRVRRIKTAVEWIAKGKSRNWKYQKMKTYNTTCAAALFCVALIFDSAMAQSVTNRPARLAPPARDPHTPGYVTATELSDGAVPPPDADGNFIIGPTHNRAPEMLVNTNVPQGTVFNFTMSSADSKIYPGIARDPGTFGIPDANDPAKLIVTTSHAAPYTRKISVYVPANYKSGDVLPFIIGADGPDKLLFTALDNLIAEKKVPAMVAISIGNGGGDAQGSERGLEYDTMSGKYAEFVEQEVLPLVEKTANVKLTKDPDARATMGGSSGGSCALIMAWYHPELYHRVLTYSGTYVNQQWPYNPETPHGAWEFHEHLIPENSAKLIRIWMEVGDRDLFNPSVMRDGMHDWVVANENMAKVLAAKNYHYQFVFAQNAGHVDGRTKQQTLPEALEWLWKDYQPVKK